jgi:hypothetical protein
MSVSEGDEAKVPVVATKVILGPVEALPDGAKDVVGPLKVEKIAAPTYVFGYSRAGQARVAVVQFDDHIDSHVLRSEISLAGVPSGFTGVDSLISGPFWGIMPLFTVSGLSSAGSGVKSVVFVEMYDAELSLVPFVDVDRQMVASFLDGSVADSDWDLSIEDVDGDRIPEVLQFERYKLGDVDIEEIRVYKWSNGQLTFDERLSWALTVRGEMFPEPEVDEDGM